jgi:hypothetical protein
MLHALFPIRLPTLAILLTAIGHAVAQPQIDYSYYEAAAPYPDPAPAGDGHYWWKGNLHTHTLWSDGDQFPEVVTQWYVAHGYHFVALSDHNILLRGERWINPRIYHYLHGRGGQVLKLYRERFGDSAEIRVVDEELKRHLLTIEPEGNRIGSRRPPAGDMEIGETLVRLKTLEEVRRMFERPERFLMIESTEITASGRQSIHINASNIVQLDRLSAGSTVEETIRRYVDAIAKQGEEYGRPTLSVLNHPNWRWGVRAEDMIPVENLRFFEVYNGGHSTGNYGDEVHAGLERVWDIVLTERLAARNLGIVYGLAVDDTHNYENSPSHRSRPGRGWVMVRSRRLDPAQIISAMQAGDFYSSTGVTLSSVRFDPRGLEIAIATDKGVTYTTEFIGTRRGYDPSNEPIRDAGGNVLNVTRRYSDDIGRVLKSVDGAVARYDFSGDEIYVRARIVSSKLHPNPFADGDTEMAWVQPVVPGMVTGGRVAD